MSKSDKLLQKMANNPKADYTPEQIKSLCQSLNITVRQNGTSHAVLTNNKGEHLTIPMHKPIKPIYIKKLIAFIKVHND